MFNPNNLVFFSREGLEFVRSIPVALLLGIEGVFLFGYLIRSFSVWKLCSRFGKGGFLLSFLPFTRVFVYSRLGKEFAGLGPKLRLFFKFYLVLYAVSIGLLLFAPSFGLMVVGLVFSVVIYFTMSFVIESISLGVVGERRVIWLVPFIGSFVMLHDIRKSLDTVICVKPVNRDGLFKKYEDLEISL